MIRLYNIVDTQVELKAFCPKHSEVPNNSNAEPVDPSVYIDKNSNISDSPHVTLSPKKSNKSKTGRRNGDNVAVTIGTSDNSDKVSDSRSQGLPMTDRGKLERSCEDVNASGALNLTPILQKVMNKVVNEDIIYHYNYWLQQHFQVLYFLLLQLIDCGKVDVKDVALEIGISPDSLSASLAVMQFK